MEKIKPEVGMGVTYLGWTDRHPYTVIEVASKTKLIVQADTWKRTDSNGQSEDQTYEYKSNPDGEKVTITLRDNGNWVEKGGTTAFGRRFHVGSRRRYEDHDVGLDHEHTHVDERQGLSGRTLTVQVSRVRPLRGPIQLSRATII